MRIYYFLFPLLIGLGSSFAQEHNKRQKIIHLGIGPIFSNFINSEAPHKINIYGSDISPVPIGGDVVQSPRYHDYETSIVKDVRPGFAIRIGVEFFLKDKWSVVSGIGYEEKGINLKSFEQLTEEIHQPDLGGENIEPGPASGILYHDETFEVKISNDYLTIPIFLRRYIAKRKIYIQSGPFMGWLLKSKVKTFNRKHTYMKGDVLYEHDSGFAFNGTDDKKEMTNKVDVGLSLGAGFSSRLTDRLTFNADCLFSVGLLKLDAKYNNEYEETFRPAYTGFTTLLRSTNYYGLNSNARNVSAGVTIGLGYTL